MTRALTAILLATVSWCGNAGAGAFEIGLPVDCTLGQDCFVQQYADVDPGPGFEDYMCGEQSYNGHKGIDIRLKTTTDAARGVNVMAVADGTVTGLRNSVPDALVTSEADKAAVKGRECGNGVVLRHADGWETQYCHMRFGSVKVEKGQTVRAGDTLGQVGYSGDAAFAHVHLDVRKDGRTVDPFRGLDGGKGGCGAGPAPLWSRPALDVLAYKPGQVLDVGIAGHAVRLDDLEAGTAQARVPTTSSRALVAWGWAINLEKGDRLVAVLRGPNGLVARTSVVLDRRKAQYFVSAGEQRSSAHWPPGRYVALFGVLRDGKQVLRAGRAYMLQ